MAPRFTGSVEHSLDQKGRVVLPARDRAKLEDLVYLSKAVDGCLTLLTPDEYEKQYAKYDNMDLEIKDNRNIQRLWSAGIAEVEIDRQGRFAIPAGHLEYAGMTRGTRVLLQGVMGRIELWDPQRFAGQVADQEARYTTGQTAHLGGGSANPASTSADSNSSASTPSPGS